MVISLWKLGQAPSRHADGVVLDESATGTAPLLARGVDHLEEWAVVGS